MTKHPQAVISLRGKYTQVDAGIARLVAGLTDVYNLTTLYSRQGSPKHKNQSCWSDRDNRAYIMFKHDDLFDSFLLEQLETAELFRPHSRTRISIEYDYRPGVGTRVIMSFPSDTIPRLEKLLLLESYSGNVRAQEI